jgi:hypothetical protein
MRQSKQRRPRKLAGLPTSNALVACGVLLGAGWMMFGTVASAEAQAAYGSYIGAGPAFGVTRRDAPNENANTSAAFAVRYKFLQAPISIRSQVLVGGDGVAIVPTVSYDIPISWQADAYVGAGAAVVKGDRTPVGNNGGFVIQPGVDYALPNSNLMLYTNAIISFGAYRSNGGVGASIQAGAGLRF